MLVIASGAHRVDVNKLTAVLGAPVRRADADAVRRSTGFAIGGVPPLGHIEPLHTLIDSDLMAHVRIWAAAGTPNTLFETSPQELLRLTGGQVVDIADRS